MVRNREGSTLTRKHTRPPPPSNPPPEPGTFSRLDRDRSIDLAAKAASSRASEIDPPRQHAPHQPASEEKAEKVSEKVGKASEKVEKVSEKSDKGKESDAKKNSRGIWTEKGPWTVTVEILETLDCGSKNIKAYVTADLPKQHVRSDDVKGNDRFMWNWKFDLPLIDPTSQLHMCLWEKKLFGDAKVIHFAERPDDEPRDDLSFIFCFQIGEYYLNVQLLEDGVRYDKWVDLSPKGRLHFIITIISEAKKNQAPPPEPAKKPAAAVMPGS